MNELARVVYGEFGVVLRHHALGYDREEWVTHEFRTDDPSNTYWGHYFASEEEARQDFMDRANRLAA